MNKIFLVRGCPGSGKSQFAGSIFADVYLETDMFLCKMENINSTFQS